MGGPGVSQGGGGRGAALDLGIPGSGCWLGRKLRVRSCHLCLPELGTELPVRLEGAAGALLTGPGSCSPVDEPPGHWGSLGWGWSCWHPSTAQGASMGCGCLSLHLEPIVLGHFPVLEH